MNINSQERPPPTGAPSASGGHWSLEGHRRSDGPARDL